MSLVNSDERRPHRLFTVAELAIHTVEDVFDFTYTNLTHAKTTYLNVAKGLIALTELGVSEDEAKETLVKRGASNHALKNARQAVKVWDTVVAGGHADEAWFDRCVYMDFVAVNRAIAKCDVKTVAELGLLGKPMHTVIDKLDRLADLGVTAYKQGGHAGCAGGKRSISTHPGGAHDRDAGVVHHDNHDREVGQAVQARRRGGDREDRGRREVHPRPHRRRRRGDGRARGDAPAGCEARRRDGARPPVPRRGRRSAQVDREPRRRGRLSPPDAHVCRTPSERGPVDGARRHLKPS